MKKIFTLAAAVLASFSLWAGVNVITEQAQVINDGSWIITGPDNAANSQSSVIFPDTEMEPGFPTGTQTAASYIKSNGTSDLGAKLSTAKRSTIKNLAEGDVITVYWFATNTTKSTITLSYAHAAGKGTKLYDSEDITPVSKTIYASVLPALTAEDITNISSAYEGTEGLGYLSCNNSIYVYAIKIEAATPSTDPVSSVEIAGPEAVYVGKVASYTATVDKKATAYKWTVNDVEQVGETSAKFNFTPDAEGTYTIKAFAQNEYNADWVASNVIALVASVKTVQPVLNTVDASITWDFNQIATANVQHENQTDTVIFANLAVDWAEGFAADKLAGCAQYFYYTSNKCFQGTQLMFVTSVPGKVSLEYSNTGGDRPYRYAEVNGVLSQEGSASTTKITTEKFDVEAGEVIIKFYISDANNPKAKDGNNVGYTMGRVYKLIFETTNTAIDNTNAEIKAVKVIRNGQLFIEKNGVIYNAQGAVVK